jgi:ligand-binding sensor domain-containing protein
MKKIKLLLLMVFVVSISANAQLTFLYEYNPSNSAIPNFEVTGIAAAPNGDVWVSTDGGGVARRRNSTWTTFNTSNSQITTNDCDEIFVAKNGNVWFSKIMSTNGSVQYDGTNWTTYQYSYRDIIDDNNNNIWMCGFSANLLKYDGTTTTIYDGTNSPLSYDNVTTVTVDDNNNLWAATNDSIFKFNGTTWTIYDSNTVNSTCMLPLSVKLDMKFDKTGKLWIAHSYGITVFNGTTWTDYDENDYGANSSIHQIAVSSNNLKYFATSDDGVLRFDGTNWVQYNYPDDFPIFKCYNSVYKIAIDKNDNKWINCLDEGSVAYFQDGSGTGVEELDNNHFSIFPNPTNNQLNITTTLQGNNDIQYQIINTLGAIVVANKTANKEFSIDVSSMSSGIYFIHLQSGNAKTVKRFVKE